MTIAPILLSLMLLLAPSKPRRTIPANGKSNCHERRTSCWRRKGRRPLSDLYCSSDRPRPRPLLLLPQTNELAARQTSGLFRSFCQR